MQNQFYFGKNHWRKMQEGSCNSNNSNNNKICLRKSLSCRTLKAGRAAGSLCLAHFHSVPWVAAVGHHWREDALHWLLGWLSAVAPARNTCRQRSALIRFPYPWFDSDGNTSPWNRHEYMERIYFIFCSCFIWTWIFQLCLSNHKKSESCFLHDRSEELSWWVVSAKHKMG